MTEKELTNADKKRIKDDISLTFIFVTLFVLAFILLFAIGFGVAYLFGVRPTSGFGTRVLIGIAALSFPIPLIAWKNIIRFIDIRRAKKLLITTSDYKIENKKDGPVLVTTTKPKLKLDLYDSIIPLLRPTDPINIEISKLSKTLLFISHDSENLIEKVEREEEK
jgi:hypothetical protein